MMNAPREPSEPSSNQHVEKTVSMPTGLARLASLRSMHWLLSQVKVQTIQTFVWR